MGTVNFNESQQFAYLEIVIKKDNYAELNESFIITLLNLTGKWSQVIL